jgi:gliding motility-associated-like protein
VYLSASQSSIFSLVGKAVLLCFLVLGSLTGHATHNRAGEIVYQRIEPFSKKVGDQVVPVYHYLITVIKYTDHDNDLSVMDRCVDTVDFGDGESGVAIRINKGVQNCACLDASIPAMGCGSVISSQASHVVKLNIYTVDHYYPGPGTYYIRSFDRNRNADVINIPNSVNVPFYIESLLIINSFSGANSSPRFTFKPVDKACVGQCFEHNPGAFDPDLQDSLSFALSVPRGEGGLPVPGYSYPPGDYSIDEHTGELRWCSPPKAGEYNLAFIVYEWRKNTNNEYQLTGYVLRDMQVIVEPCDQQSPPQVTVPAELCVEAGQRAERDFHVSDADRQFVTLTFGGSPFEGPPPLATVTNTAGGTGTSGFDALFSWQTACDHIRRLPYQVTVKAQDNGTPVGQVSFASFRIRVVPPAITGFTAFPSGSTMRLTWHAAPCDPLSNPLQHYLIYRRKGCGTEVYSPCQGRLDTLGYQLIKKQHKDSLSFTDHNNGLGLVVGETYRYIIRALYRDGAESAAGAGACGELKRDVPLPLHADVRKTSPDDGSLFVDWARPLKTPGNFDTTAFPGPYSFKLLYRPPGGGSFSEIFSSTAQYLHQLDTSFLHGPINTVSGPHTYKVVFYARELERGSSQLAGSVILKARGGDRKVQLEWSALTPWTNYRFRIHRSVAGSSLWSVVGSSDSPFFTDSVGILNGHSYCYRVEAEGRYSDPGVPAPLLNFSQDTCVAPKDLTPPCTPSIDLQADCPSGYVLVNWTDVAAGCPKGGDLAYYILYHKSYVGNEFLEVARGSFTSYEFSGLSSVSGCYAVQALDTNGNAGRLSAEFCIDNCPVFELPNVFTPNGDGANDHFKAVRVRQIKRISLVVLDRWGSQVYGTTDPYFHWNGVSSATSQPCSEGTFYYYCEVYEPRLQGEVRRTLRGSVHLAR